MKINFFAKDRLQKISILAVIAISFCILSYLYVYPLLSKGMIFNGDDAWYQIDRIIEIKRNLEHGNFLPFMYTYTFGQIGYPLGIFYPEIILIVSAVVSLFFKYQVTGIYAGIAVYTLITLVITYYVCRKIGRTRAGAYIGAILYAFAAYRTVDGFARFAIGEFIAMSFLPLCFYGFYAILADKYKEWPYLSIGVSFVLLSHILTTFIIVITMLLLGIIFIFKVSQPIKKIKYFAISGIGATLSSAIFLIPFLEQELSQKYNKPSPVNLQQTAQKFSDMVLSALNNSIEKNLDAAYSIGILSIVILLLGAILFKSLSRLDKINYIVATISFIGSSQIFPWGLLQNTPISVIQYTFRLLIIPTLLYSLVGASIFDICWKKYGQKRIDKILILGIVMAAILGSWYTSVETLSKETTYTSLPALTNSTNISNDTIYVEQYTPRKAVPYLKDIKKHIAIVDEKKVTLKEIKVLPSKLTFKDKSVINANKVDLPIAYYKNYVAYCNGKQLKVTRSKRNTLQIESKTKGIITVEYRYSNLDFIGILISIMSWIVFLIWLVWSKIKKFKNLQ